MDRIQKLIPLVRPFYDTPDPAHDWAHVGRVAATAERLSKDLDVDLECVLAAVYCHDLVNLPKNHPERKNASVLAADKAEVPLVKVGFDLSERQIIRAAIIEHSFSRGQKPSSFEGAIVQDADRLDALGAIGVLRCAAVNAQMGSNFYDPFDPLAEDRELDDKKFMLDHYFVKLFRLPDLMNTEAGRNLAEERVRYMKTFIVQFMEEIRGR